MLSGVITLLTNYLNTSKYIPTVSLTLNKEERIFFSSAEDAARFIQKFWRLAQLRRQLAQDPYHAYVRLVAINDPLRALSLKMLGQRQSDVLTENNLIRNPFKSITHYHRTSITKQETEQIIASSYTMPSAFFLPLVSCQTTPILKLLASILPPKTSLVQLTKSIDNPLVFAHLNSNALTDKDMDDCIELIIRSSGIIASPWEISRSTCKSTHPLRFLKRNKIKSDALKKLRLLANNDHAPTHLLANALIHLLTDLSSLSSQAMDRIDIIINIMTLFYSYDYSLFAQHMYYIIHEISLSLVDIDKVFLAKQFEIFQNKSQKTLLFALGLQERELPNHHFICAPALSGSHAHMQALTLAHSLVPFVYSPIYFDSDKNYFEFSQFHPYSKKNNANIFFLTTGPICFEKVWPGVDINLFIKNHIIDEHKKQPVVLLIDITTTLYKNLRLNRESMKLFKSGQLALIFFESNQKFGLLHSDQAQCGRMMALYSTKTFYAKNINHFKSKIIIDYYHHIDLRINVYIRSRCEAILEQIKQQHFNQGASLNDFMEQFNLSQKTTAVSQDSLYNKEELYFCLAGYDKKNKLQEILPIRHSFGHFDTTITGSRISANASDRLDSWLEITKIYLHVYLDSTNQEDLTVFLLNKSLNTDKISVTEQIIYLSLANYLIQANKQLLIDNLFFLIWTKKLLSLCVSLIHRPIYNFIYSHLIQAQKEIKALVLLPEWPLFIRLFEFLLTQEINYKNPSSYWMSKDQLALLSISFIDVLINYYFLTHNSATFLQDSSECFNIPIQQLQSNIKQRSALKEAFLQGDNSPLGLFQITNIFLDNRLTTPLYLAILKSKTHWASQIIANHGLIFTSFLKRNTALLEAAQKGQKKVLFSLLQQISTLPHSVIKQQLAAIDNNGFTALHWAAFHGNASACRLLIRLNINIFSLLNEEEHALYLTTSYAVQKLFEEYWIIKKILLEAAYSHQKTPMILAFFKWSYALSEQKRILIERYQSIIDELNNKVTFIPFALSLSAQFELLLTSLENKPQDTQIKQEPHRFFKPVLKQIKNLTTIDALPPVEEIQCDEDSVGLNKTYCLIS
ncbi:MAG: hypothetical protein CK426_05280 [Legionella sp.]|nr:MAG: hypothetical protein CK423_06410 [Legionella sp.]PJD98675.1 MAG: hypothetical protein CK426_05280 [Legionella sp.]